VLFPAMPLAGDYDPHGDRLLALVHGSPAPPWLRPVFQDAGVQLYEVLPQ